MNRKIKEDKNWILMLHRRFSTCDTIHQSLHAHTTLFLFMFNTYFFQGFDFDVQCYKISCRLKNIKINLGSSSSDNNKVMRLKRDKNLRFQIFNIDDATSFCYLWVDYRFSRNTLESKIRGRRTWDLFFHGCQQYFSEDLLMKLGKIFWKSIKICLRPDLVQKKWSHH